jgi:pimeloyl-ACP methyl ester carboxylesterase
LWGSFDGFIFPRADDDQNLHRVDDDRAESQTVVTLDAKAYRIAERRFWMRAVGVVPMEHDVDLPGLGTSVRVLTHGAGPTIVLVHGGSSAAASWAPLVKRLADFRCVMIEQPGAGLSEPAKKGARRVREYVVQMLRELLDAIGLDQSAIVASSFGSYIALVFAAAHPERVSRMVHLGAPALVPGVRTPLPLLAQSFPIVGPVLRRVQKPSLERSRRMLGQMGHEAASLSRPDIMDMLKWYTALSAHTPTRENDATLFGRVRRRDLLSMTDLSLIATPMSFFWGERDTFGAPDAARTLVDAIPNARLEMVPDAGHLPWLDASKRAAEHLTAFMAPRRALSRRTRSVRGRVSRSAATPKSSAVLRVV